jgi:hypothetical protein
MFSSMRSRARIVTLVASLCIGVSALVGVARAQQATPAPAPAPEGTAALQRPVDLDPAEMAKQADTAIARIDLGGRNVRKQLETARSARDVVKTLCLSDRLTQLDVTLRSARERKGALDAAVQRSDKDLAGHEFTIIGVYRQRSERLVGEANQCVGSEVGIIGDTRVSMNVDPNIPENEGGPAAPLPAAVVVPPAACESCAFLGSRPEHRFDAFFVGLDVPVRSWHGPSIGLSVSVQVSISIDPWRRFDEPPRDSAHGVRVRLT